MLHIPTIWAVHIWVMCREKRFYFYGDVQLVIDLAKEILYSIQVRRAVCARPGK